MHHKNELKPVRTLQEKRKAYTAMIREILHLASQEPKMRFTIPNVHINQFFRLMKKLRRYQNINMLAIADKIISCIESSEGPTLDISDPISELAKKLQKVHLNDIIDGILASTLLKELGFSNIKYKKENIFKQNKIYLHLNIGENNQVIILNSEDELYKHLVKLIDENANSSLIEAISLSISPESDKFETAKFLAFEYVMHALNDKNILFDFLKNSTRILSNNEVFITINDSQNQLIYNMWLLKSLGFEEESHATLTSLTREQIITLNQYAIIRAIASEASSSRTQSNFFDNPESANKYEGFCKYINRITPHFSSMKEVNYNEITNTWNTLRSLQTSTGIPIPNQDINALYEIIIKEDTNSQHIANRSSIK